MSTKTNINWNNKNLIIMTEFKTPIDIFQNNINISGDNGFYILYLLINIFENDKITKIEFSDKNGNQEIYLDRKNLQSNNEHYKTFFEFINFCKYLINSNESNDIDIDDQILFNKKYDKIKKIIYEKQ